MSMMLNSMSESIYKETKKAIGRNLESLTFDMSRVTVEKKEWNLFKDKLNQSALTLIREINRSQNNYKQILVEDIFSEFKEIGDIFSFGFSGGNGTVQISYKKGTDNFIRFERIDESIFEESLSLF